MHSDTGFERLIKLWISLWELVLTGKRHLETVTTLLQRLVFEHQGYPRFKNWAEICKVGEVSQMMMITLASLDLTTPTTIESSRLLRHSRNASQTKK